MPIIKSIHIYPIKSCCGVQVESAQVCSTGLAGDRQYMLVDDKGVFQTQRKNPKMAVIKIQLRKDGNLVVNEGNKSIEINPSHFKSTQKVMIWEDAVQATLASNEVNQWFSDILNLKVSLVKYSSGSRIREKIPPFETAFADGYPILITNITSLTAIEKQLEETIRMDRFRPNIVVDFEKEGEEYHLGHFNINNAELYNVKPCQRCNVIRINQQTGTVLSSRILSHIYDIKTKSAFFGINCTVQKNGCIRIGDQLTKLEYKKIKN